MPESVLFVPECHVDTALTRTLLAERLTFINHQHGIYKVANVLRLQAESGKARFVVGMANRDKKFADVKYLQPFANTTPVAARPGPNCRYAIHRHPAQPATPSLY